MLCKLSCIIFIKRYCVIVCTVYSRNLCTFNVVVIVMVYRIHDIQ